MGNAMREDDNDIIYESKKTIPIFGLLILTLCSILIIILLTAYFLDQMDKDAFCYLPTIILGSLIISFGYFSFEPERIIISKKRIHIRPNTIGRILRSPDMEFNIADVKKVRRIANWIVFEMKDQPIADKKDLKEYNMRMLTHSWKSSQKIFEDINRVMKECKKH